jgi:Aph-1 protein
MGLLSFFGGLLLAFSPLFSVFFLHVAKRPRRVILAIGASFFWLLGSFAAALLWFLFAVPVLRASAAWMALWGASFGELFRFLFLWTFQRGEKGFSAVAPPDAPPAEHRGAARGTRAVEMVTRDGGDDNGSDDDNILDSGSGDRRAPSQRRRGWRPLEMRAPTVSTAHTAVAFGVGTGLAHALVMYGTMLSQAADGPAVFFSATCPTFNGIGTSAFFAMLFSLLHLFWSVPALHSFSPRDNAPRNWRGIAWVVGSHFIAALCTLPSSAPDGCVPSMLLLLLWTAVNGAACLFTVLPALAPRVLERPIEMFLVGP